MYDIEGCYNLIAQVYQRAIMDARNGDLKAIDWLDVVAPDWRERCNGQKRGKQ